MYDMPWHDLWMIEPKNMELLAELAQIFEYIYFIWIAPYKTSQSSVYAQALA